MESTEDGEAPEAEGPGSETPDPEPTASATFGKPEADPTDTLEDVSPIEALEQERDNLKDRLLRTAADFDNFRKRSRKTVEEAERRGRETVLREVLPIIDNLERAVQASEGVEDVEAVRDGVRMVLKLFEDVAGRIGLERVEAVGKRFDPNFHDAFQQVETEEHPPGTVVQEYQPGYLLDDKLLRPAMVVVARPPPEPSPPPEGDDEGE